MDTTNHDKIRVLDDRQKAREKIAIWFGSSSNYYHPIKETIANGTDEIINNFESGEVEVILHEDLQTITVKDTGRGIPIAGETNGIKNYELLFRTLFAGTKYDEGEQTTTGTNGVGMTVVNFTSSIFEVESCYDGHMYTLKFANGGELVQDLKTSKCSKNIHGTTITFKLDSEIYPTITYNKDEVLEIVKRFAVSSSKVTLKFRHQDEEQIFHYDSVEEYFNELIKNTLTCPIATMPEAMYDEENEKTQIKVILATNPEPIQESYLNLTYLAEGGSFNEGVIAGVRLYANKYCKDNRLFPRGVTGFTTNDIETSVSFVCVALSNNVEFQNQTKLSTAKNLYRKLAQKHTLQLLEIFKIENEDGMKKLVNHLLAVQRHNAASQKAKQQLRRRLSERVDGIGNKVANLVDCKKHGPQSEIFIAEGQSALGSIVLARDALHQAAFPLRGKILNCLKADYTAIFKNQIITDLVRVLGCGIQADRRNRELESFDINKLRYGKIIIATDADSDGAQIAALIITMLYRLMPELLLKGYVYIAKTPLYELKLSNDQMIYYYSESEKESELPKVQGKYTIARVKGLGELTPEVMNETAMNPKTRNLVRITVEDAKKMSESLETWMAIDVTNRKQYIEQNLDRYVEGAI